MPVPQYSLGIDIGGTFTDLVVYDHDDRRRGAARCSPPTTTRRARWPPGWRGLLAQARLDPAAFARVVHATTLFTNALIERKGAVTGLITTAGFADTLEIGRERKYELYDLAISQARAARAAPPAPRGDRAHAGRRPRRAAPRRARRWPRGPGALASGRGRGDRGGVPARLRQPAPRGGGGAADRAAPSRHRGDHLARGGAGDPRVRARVHHRGQRLHQAARPALPRADGPARGGAGHPGAAPAHALERRAHPRGGGAARAGADARVGAGRGRHRGRLLRPGRQRGGRVLAFDMGGTTAKLSLVDGGEPLTAYASRPRGSGASSRAAGCRSASPPSS